MTSPVDFSTGDIWRAASDKSPFQRSEARHRRAWKGLWKVEIEELGSITWLYAKTKVESLACDFVERCRTVEL